MYPIDAISIHTPLAGSDYWWFRAFRPSRNFNPHSPCGERHNPHCCLGRLKYFNPHSPCGERPSPFPVLDAGMHFNPHSPCGERQCFITQYVCHLQFQSTLPLRGATANASTPTAVVKFQSTLPLRGATRAALTSDDSDVISIHTPLAGSDVLDGAEFGAFGVISIHTPLAGSDGIPILHRRNTHHFNPHSPCGERRLRSDKR